MARRQRLAAEGRAQRGHGDAAQRHGPSGRPRVPALRGVRGGRHVYADGLRRRDRRRQVDRLGVVDEDRHDAVEVFAAHLLVDAPRRHPRGRLPRRHGTALPRGGPLEVRLPGDDRLLPRGARAGLHGLDSRSGARGVRLPRRPRRGAAPRGGRHVRRRGPRRPRAAQPPDDRRVPAPRDPALVLPPALPERAPLRIRHGGRGDLLGVRTDCEPPAIHGGQRLR
mmetsp:Transcript_11970/g.35668  ORF Transcript_11970/g.35668 Transcript_11970/m.35668 type:complete len:224 (-) Transcript_11970:365-1036(-)